MNMRKDPVCLSPLQGFLENLHGELSCYSAGEMASYIPELSNASPDWFGIAIATVDGHIYQVGDTRQAFTIQSISKVLSYGLALEDNGIEAVLEKVGVEPSGETFNSISLEPDSGRPRNPMINAGAIATTGMVRGQGPAQRMQSMLNTFERYTGHAASVDEAVYQSEKATGHRNRGIACLLQEFGILDGNADDALDLYFRQCSISVNCRDLALTAACLANNGVNPVTGVTALDKQYVDKVLSVMGSCGMYDYSGNWLYNVGMPAKSGVAGGIMAVLPGQLGIGVFSPPLDSAGNSCRGIKVCERISQEFALHLYDTVRSTSASVIRVAYDATQIRSRKQRRSQEAELIRTHGDAIRIYELQGELKFASTDSLIDLVLATLQPVRFLIFNFRRTVEIDRSAQRLFVQLLKSVQAAGCGVFFTGMDAHYSFVRLLSRQYRDESEMLLRFQDADHALEWCEDELLASHGLQLHEDQQVELDEHELCAGLSRNELALIRNSVRPVTFDAGDVVFRYGDPGDSMYFIVQGTFEVLLRTVHQQERRLTTLSAGTTFGELALLNRNRRSAEVRAVRHSLCYQLHFNELGSEITMQLLANLANKLAGKLEQDAIEIMKLS